MPTKPAVYALSDTPLPFHKTSWFRWEKLGLIPPMLRIGGKVTVQRSTVEAILSGEIKLPSNTPRARRAKLNAKPKAAASAAE